MISRMSASPVFPSGWCAYLKVFYGKYIISWIKCCELRCRIDFITWFLPCIFILRVESWAGGILVFWLKKPSNAYSCYDEIFRYSTPSITSGLSGSVESIIWESFIPFYPSSNLSFTFETMAIVMFCVNSVRFWKLKDSVSWSNSFRAFLSSASISSCLDNSWLVKFK